MAQVAPSAAPSSGDLLVPRLPVLPGPGGADPVAVATWHLAVSNLIGAVIPHQLFGLWVFPHQGAPVLLGPEELGQDHLPIPTPDPFLSQDQLFELEETLRRASYASAVALPIHGTERDVGLALIGTFEAGAYGHHQIRHLRRLGVQLFGTLDPLSRAIRGKAEPSAIVSEPSEEDLPETLIHTVVEAPSGSELVRRLSGVLHAYLPHDRLELLAYLGPGGAVIPLSGSLARRRWGRTSPGWDDLAKSVDQALGGDPTVALGTINGVPAAPPWPAAPGSPRIQSLLAARLSLGEQSIGILLFGHAGEDVYRPGDEELAERVARLASPRVAAFRFEAEAKTLQGQLESLKSPSLPVIRCVESLATTTHLGEALHRFGAEVSELVRFERIRYRLRWSDSELVTLSPEAIRPLAELQKTLIDDEPAGEVLEGTANWWHGPADGGEVLAVVLRVADRRIGLMVLEAADFSNPRGAAAAVLPLADVVAPHLELLRRGSVAPLRSPASAPASTRGD